MKNHWNILVLGFLIMSCTSFKEIERSNRDYVDEANMFSLAGVYESIPHKLGNVVYLSKPISVGDESQHNLLFERFKLSPTKNYADSASRFFVQVQPVNKKTIALNLIKDSEIQKTKRIKGKYKDGYFYRRKQLIIVPFVPILFGFRAQRQRIGLENDLLIVDLRINMWVSFLIAGRFESSQQEAKYKRAVKH
ncbi:hypothetical protein D770_22745 [Flammeovirgaceae bacterium 311]|nr:hypothetical protein D770_22745 [Flammeovirgaceae bacterium 311]